MHIYRTAATGLMLGVAMTALPALAGHEVVVSAVAGDPTAEVPGSPGEFFTDFRRPIRSPDGSKWILSARTTAGSVLLVGSGTSAGVVLREGDAAPWAPGETVGDLWIHRNIAILNDGRYVLTNSTNGGPTGANTYVVMWDGLQYQVVAQEGQAAGDLAPALFGSGLDSAQMSTDGLVGFRASGLQGAASGADTALFFGGAAVAQTGVDAPSGQAFGAQTYRDFTLREYYHSADGAHWIVNGRLNGDLNSDRVAVVDGAIVAQEGVIIPGSGFASPVGAPASGFQPISDVQMMPGGDWYVRGANADGVGWVIRNGAVAASSYTPITPGATERWDPFLFLYTFFTSIGNDRGDSILGGTTDTFPVDYGGVMVLNGEHVVVRSFDPVDLNGNGMDDEDVYINNFLFDDAFLTDAGDLFVVVVLRDSAGNTMGEALLHDDLSGLIGPACPCETDGRPGVDVFDLLAYLDLWFADDPGAERTGDDPASVDVFDLLAYLDCWFDASAGGACP